MQVLATVTGKSKHKLHLYSIKCYLIQAIKAAEEHLTVVAKEQSEYKAVCKVRKANLAALFTSNNTFQPPPPGCAFPPHKAVFVLASAVVC